MGALIAEPRAADRGSSGCPPAFASQALPSGWSLTLGARLGRPPDGRNRPFAVLRDRPYERAGSARKRSSAEGVGCARTDRSRSKLRTRPFDPKRAFLFGPGTE